MKKALSIALALVMTMSLCTAFAGALAGEETIKAEGGQAVFEVNGYYETNTKPPVISVDVAWGDMTFLYHTAAIQVWNPDSHTYRDSENTTGWMPVETDGDLLTITNHSNVAVDADVTIESQRDGVTMQLKEVGNESNTASGQDGTLPLELASGEGLTPENADAAKVRVVPTGTLNSTDTVRIAQISVTVNQHV